MTHHGNLKYGGLGEGEGGQGHLLNRKQASTVILALSVQIGCMENGQLETICDAFNTKYVGRKPLSWCDVIIVIENGSRNF
jgi:hypothetical protein